MNPYDKAPDETIDVCLNCEKAVCHGTCELVRRLGSDFIIRRNYLDKKGYLHTAYIVHVSTGKITSTTDIERARKFGTYEVAKYYADRAKNIAAAKSHFTIVRKDEELERINKSE